jgi:8-oxo-dGTP diphosphatase
MPKHPSKQDIKLAADAVIFTVSEGALQVLLIQMKKKPYAGAWAVPGGLLGQDETSEGAARRILSEQTGVEEAYLEQLATFDDPARDRLGRVVSVAYFALIPDTDIALRTTDKYAAVRWWPVARLPKLAYDHQEVVRTALGRIRAKAAYANVAWSLLPKTFPLSRLRETYEAILGREIDKRNFRKKIVALGLIEATGKKTEGGAHRPAELYRFRSRKPEIIDLF